MPRFYFNVIKCSTTISDREGTELPDLESAEAEAKLDALEIMSDAVLKGRDVSARSIEICNEEGKVLVIVPFASAFSHVECHHHRGEIPMSLSYSRSGMP